MEQDPAEANTYVPEPELVILPQPASPDSTVIGPLFTGSFEDRNVYAETTRTGLFSFNVRWYYAQDTQLSIATRVLCPEAPVVTLTDVALLELPDSVSVHEWWALRHTDFGNWTRHVVPVRHELVSGRIRFDDAYFERAYKGADREEVLILRYGLIFEHLVFSNGFRVQRFESERYSCYPGTEYWDGGLYNGDPHRGTAADKGAI